MQRTAWMVLCSMVFTSGCADEPEPPEAGCPRGFLELGEADGGPACGIDVYEVGQLVAAITQKGPYLEPINAEPFVQQHGPEKLRVIYASTNVVRDFGMPVTAADLYRTIDPEDLQSTLELEMPMGSIFVHYTPDGPPYGVMTKQSAGTDPDNHDWFFGRFDEYGYPVPLESYDGQTCRDCHVMDDRPARTDMLWGVPRAAL